MKSTNLLSVVAISLVALAITSPLSAQDNPNHKPRHHKYQLIDLGTFGGPNSETSVGAVALTSAGIIGGAQTPTADPYDPNCLFSPGCFVAHAFHGWHGMVTDLGALPGNGGKNTSYAFAINNDGLIAGISENGSVDLATGYPEVNAVVWNKHGITNLGTFGGTQSAAYMMNDRGQVVGNALNAIPDPFSFGGQFPGTTQAHAFIWEKENLQDLGTLGGPDSIAYIINQRGQAAGWSYTNDIPNPTTGVPTIDPFLWNGNRMIDLGTLGGTRGLAQWVNNRGQVVGYSNLAGDQLFHGFLWDRGTLNDLPPVSGGSISEALWVNDAGDAVGGSSIAGDQLFHAPLWTRGRAIDLGTVGQDACSQAYAINSSRQIVGVSGGMGQCSSFQAGRAFLWENDGPMVDLNALVENPSDLSVYWGINITDDGNIAAEAILPNGDIHAVLLVPRGDCDDRCEQRIAESQNMAVGRPATIDAMEPPFGRPSNWIRNAFGRGSTTGLEPVAPSK